MPVQLFRLRGVPDDEADEIRQLLADHDIDYYETPAGNWGISMPAIWLRDAARLEEAKALIEKYQQARFVRIRSEYNELKEKGKQPTILDQFKAKPIQFLLYLAFAAVIIYFSTQPFLRIVR